MVCHISHTLERRDGGSAKPSGGHVPHIREAMRKFPETQGKGNFAKQKGNSTVVEPHNREERGCFAKQKGVDAGGGAFAELTEVSRGQF